MTCLHGYRAGNLNYHSHIYPKSKASFYSLEKKKPGFKINIVCKTGILGELKDHTVAERNVMVARGATEASFADVSTQRGGKGTRIGPSKVKRMTS